MEELLLLFMEEPGIIHFSYSASAIAHIAEATKIPNNGVTKMALGQMEWYWPLNLQPLNSPPLP